jgi:hypothetical protein
MTHNKTENHLMGSTKLSTNIMQMKGKKRATGLEGKKTVWMRAARSEQKIKEYTSYAKRSDKTDLFRVV